MFVGEYVLKVPKIEFHMEIKEAAVMLGETGAQFAEVWDNTKLIGVLEKDKLNEAMISGKTGQLKDCINGNIILVSHDLLVNEAARLSADWFVAMGDKQKVLGIVSRNDIMRHAYHYISDKQRYFTETVNQANNGIIVINKDGQLDFVNIAAKKLINGDGTEMYNPLISQLQAVLDEGKASLGQKVTLTLDKSTRKEILTNQVPVWVQGKKQGAIAILHDLSEMESVSQELTSVKQLNNQLEAIIQASFDGVIIADSNGMILKINKAIEKLLSVKEEDFIGEKIGDPHLEKLLPKHLLNSVQETGEVVSVVSEIQDRQLLLTANPVNNGAGMLANIVINVRDLTKLNNLKQELKKTQELYVKYHNELEVLRKKYLKQENIVVNSSIMRAIFETASRVAQVDSTVIIFGESGVGKEIVAKYIHGNSCRSKEPFITLNCGAIPENLLESELFGYEAGAFTGASKTGKVGLFEVAHKGTLFLDEIGELPMQFQVKLLRAIQHKEIARVGGSRLRKVDVRIIAATNRDLKEMVEEKQFREDLYFRLNVIPIKVPSLRERKEEVPYLCTYFLNSICKRLGFKKRISPEAIDIMMKYDWPGNIRELENVIERVIVTSRNQEIICEDLPVYILEPPAVGENEILVKGIQPLKHAVLEVEKQIIEKAVLHYGSIRKAAEVLDVDQSTIVRKMQRIKETLGYGFEDISSGSDRTAGNSKKVL